MGLLVVESIRSTVIYVEVCVDKYFGRRLEVAGDFVGRCRLDFSALMTEHIFSLRLFNTREDAGITWKEKPTVTCKAVLLVPHHVTRLAL